MERNLKNRTLKLTQIIYIKSFLKNFDILNIIFKWIPINKKIILLKAVKKINVIIEFKIIY